MNKEDILNRFEEVKDKLTFDNKCCLVYEFRNLEFITLNSEQISNLEEFIKCLPDDLVFDFLMNFLDKNPKCDKTVEFLRKHKQFIKNIKQLYSDEKPELEPETPKKPKEVEEYPPHLSFVEVEIHPGLKGFGRVYHNQDFYKTISVSGVTCDVDGVMHDKGFWFEWSIQLNHPHIKVKWKMLQNS